MKNKKTKSIFIPRAMSIVIKEYKSESLKPRLKNQKYIELFPDIFGEYVSMQFHNTNNAVANAFRRVISSELPVKYLTLEYNDIITDDKYIIGEMIIQRINSIPLVQDCPDGAKFRLDYTNTTSEVVRIKSGNIKIEQNGNSQAIFFNKNIELLTLNPGRQIHMRSIYVTKEYGYKEGFATLACNVASVAITDKKLKSQFDRDGESSLIANITSFTLSFNTKGTMSTKNIMKYACDTLLLRLDRVLELLPNIQANGQDYHFKIAGENMTLGNLIMRIGYQLYEDVLAINAKQEVFPYSLTIFTRTSVPIEEFYEKIIFECKKIINSIKKNF